VVARMVGMVVGIALLTAIGLHQYYLAVAALPDRTDTEALKDAAVLQVAWAFRGAAVAAALGAVASLALGVRRRVGAERATTFGL
ncbi:MAG TPA: MFS transporter, partial [Ornithinibacter sp.]|nr:MFS transporter [Ornithinibacter sp.]